MAKKTIEVLKLVIGDWTLKVEQKDHNTFTVRYGQATKHNLTRVTAARELGECIMHALETEGKLDWTA